MLYGQDRGYPMHRERLIVFYAAFSLSAAAVGANAQGNVFMKSPVQNALSASREEIEWRSLARQHFGEHVIGYDQELELVSIRYQVPVNLVQAIAERESTDENAIKVARKVGECIARPIRFGYRHSEALAQCTNYTGTTIQEIIHRSNEIYDLKYSSENELDYFYIKKQDGHFFVIVKVNGVDLRMLVDTGATRVVLSWDDARQAGISVADAAFTYPVQTASGQVYVAEATVHDMVVEGRAIGAMSVFVLPPGSGDSLLGMSALSRFGRIEIHGDQMLVRR